VIVLAHFPSTKTTPDYPSGREILEEVIMSRTRARVALCVLAVILLGAAGTLADDVGFSGGIGLELTYTPVPPTSYNIGSDFTLSFSVSGFSFASETGFDLDGFQSERVTLGVDLGAVWIGDEVVFDPFFSWNELSIDLSIVGVHVGVDIILADIGSVQTPAYSVGAVIEFASEIVCGFSIASLTGFGAIDLINVYGGIESPFAYELLYLFHHLDGLCTPPLDLEVTIVPDFYFEEQLVRLEVDYMGLIASNTTWFDDAGLAKMLFELGYRFGEPSLSFLSTMSLDGLFVITGLDFILDLQIEVVRFTSHTWFVENPPPAVVPIVFDGQSFAVSFDLCGVLITTQTDFDGSFSFSQQLIAIEAEIDPVRFRSLTTFDAGGFAGQCIYADVTFCGVMLFTKAEFGFSGIQAVSLGIELVF